MRDKIRQEVNRDVRRQRRKPLPEGFERWEFNCRVGLTPETSEVRSLKDVGHAIEAIAVTGATAVYVEILPVPMLR